MKKIADLTQEELKELYGKAFTYKHDHADHVALLLNNAEYCTSPSGSDMFHPELWKESHWRWYHEVLDSLLDEA